MVEITTTDTGVPEMQALLGDALNAFNLEATGYSDRRPLAVVVRDDAGVAVGGAAGRTAMGVAFLDLFYLPPDLRGSGVGSDVTRRETKGCPKAGRTLTVPRWSIPEIMTYRRSAGTCVDNGFG